MADKILLIDPNPKDGNPLGSNVTTPEQLSISVDLKTYRKQRSAIALSKDKVEIQTGAQIVPVSFIGGSEVGNTDGKRSLTTHYTELSTNFNSGNKDLETLGIKDIQIEFNSACAPIIVINFVDVRGKLFEMGNDSPYSVFFELPYPIFELTIKGYYGKAVTYRLHLTKFNGRFDYSTGNFEVQCDFIGYTYAFLSDIIMGHLKGITYTERGKEKVKVKKAEKDGVHSFITFPELNHIIENISTNFNKLKSENPQLRAIKKAQNLKETLSTFKSNLLSNLNALPSKIGENNLEGFYAFKKSTSTQIIDIDELQIAIGKYNELVKEDLRVLNGDEMLDNGFKLNENNFIIQNGVNFFQNIQVNDFAGSFDDYYQNVQPTNRYESAIGGDEPTYRNVQLGVKNIRINEVSFDNSIRVINLLNGLDEIKALEDKIDDDIKVTLPILSNAVLNDSDIFSYGDSYFNPSIGNLINLICDHVDIFLDCIRDVAVEAEKDSNVRADQLRKISESQLDMVGGKLGNLKAFPRYTELVDGVQVDKWIGRIAPDMPEVKFVEDLLNGILESRKDDEDTFKNLYSNSGVKHWFPVNPFDTVIAGIDNPYKGLEKDAALDDYVRLIILRAVIYMGYSNKELTADEIKRMASLEANNVNLGVINNQIKSVLNNYSTGASLSDATGGKFTNYTTSGYTQSNYQIDNLVTSAPVRSAILSEKPINYISGSNQVETRYEYVYNYAPVISGNTLNYGKSFIPLTAPTYKDYNSNFIAKNGNIPSTNADRITLRDEEDLIFFSSIVGAVNDTSKADDGATTIKILKSRNQVEGKINYPEYGDKVVDMSTKIVDMDAKKIDGGPSNNFFNVKFGDYNNVSSSMMFYSDRFAFNYFSTVRNKGMNDQLDRFSITSSRITDVPNLKTILLASPKQDLVKVLASGGDVNKYNFPFLMFKGKKNTHYSVFGSDLYYSQNNIKAKAYLFLHALPFEGLKYNFDKPALFDGEYIHKLFDQKAGFVEVPYSWVLFLGALLSRMRGDYTVTYNSAQMSYVPHLPKSAAPSPMEFSIDKGLTTGAGYLSFSSDRFELIDDITKKLPDSAKNAFIKEFNDWISAGSFDKIRNEYEIFNEGVSRQQRYAYWSNFTTRRTADATALYTDPILKSNVKSNYSILLKHDEGFKETQTVAQVLTQVQADDSGSPFNFHLEAREKSELVRKTFDFMLETRVIANSTWRIWVDEGGIFPEDEAYGVERLQNTPIRVPKTDMETYLNQFFSELKRLNKNADILESSSSETLKEELFQTINNDDIKLNLYIKIKSLYDKWICGEDSKYVGLNSDNLYDSFRFIDRAYHNIEDSFKINLVPTIEELTGKYNQSFYNYIARVLGDNNFDFFPLPSYINYTDYNDVKDVFKPYTYNSQVTTVGPQFVCMYIGERSNVLHETANFSDDSIDFITDNVPADFKEGNEPIPAFHVQYGVQSQSIFKDIQLNQSEFTATDESLTITNNLTLNGVSSIGQNLFDVYINRSYTAHVEMLGNVMIQPLMYFQLSNIPMFRGVYTIIKVRHTIKPNTMTTMFSGVRVRFPKTKMVDETTIFMNLFSNLEDINTEGANLNDLISQNEYSQYITYKFNEGQKPGLVKQKKNVDEYCIREVGEFIEYVANIWHTKSISKAYSDTLYYNDLSRFGGGDVPDHKGHEKGTSIDFRPMTTDKEVRLVKVGDTHYDREATKQLIQLFIDSQSKVAGWEGNRIIKEIYFNDDVLIQHFSNSSVVVKRVAGHDNHVHIEFNIPKRVYDTVENGQVVENFDPTMTGQLKPLPKGNIPTNNERLTFLGKI